MRWVTTLAVAGLVVAGGACGDADDTVFVAESAVSVEVPAGGPTTTARSTTTVPETIVPIEIDRAWSPANAIAQIEGRGATVTDPVTVDGDAATTESFVDDDGGGFVLQVRIEDEGAHTVCVRDACSRVYTLAADADTPAEVTAKIDAAIVEAAGIFDGQTRFADWTITAGGSLGGTGGSTDAASKTITVYANRGRTVDEFVTTILHEWGHVVDAELMTDDARTAYLALRGYDPASDWDSPESHRLEDWAASPIEDFAEVMVVAWTEGAHRVRTSAPAGQPDAEVVAEVLALVDL
jgi:hypothetical protein